MTQPPDVGKHHQPVDAETDPIAAAYYWGFIKGFSEATRQLTGAKPPELPDSPTVPENTKLSDIGLPTRVWALLKRNRIQTVGDVVKRTADELRDIRLFGEWCLKEVERRLAHVGYALATTPQA